jgi:hypothetical protein
LRLCKLHRQLILLGLRELWLLLWLRELWGRLLWCYPGGLLLGLMLWLGKLRVLLWLLWLGKLWVLLRLRELGLLLWLLWRVWLLLLRDLLLRDLLLRDLLLRRRLRRHEGDLVRCALFLWALDRAETFGQIW